MQMKAWNTYFWLVGTAEFWLVVIAEPWWLDQVTSYWLFSMLESEVSITCFELGNDRGYFWKFILTPKTATDLAWLWKGRSCDSFTPFWKHRVQWLLLHPAMTICFWFNFQQLSLSWGIHFVCQPGAYFTMYSVVTVYLFVFCICITNCSTIVIKNVILFLLHFLGIFLENQLSICVLVNIWTFTMFYLSIWFSLC